MRPGRAALALLALLLIAPSVSAAWPMEGGDARRSGTVTFPIPTADVTLAWNGTGQYTGIAVAKDGSVVGTGDPVTVWEKDGTVRWSTRTVGPQQQVFRARGAPGLLSDGTIVAAGALPFGAAAIVGYDPRDGTQRFVNREIRGTCDSLDDGAVAVGADDTFFVGHCGPGVVAFWPNGTIRWTHTVNAERVALHGTSLFLVADGYTLPNGTRLDDLVVALSQVDGRFLWAHQVEARGDTVIGSDGTVYVLGGFGVVAMDGDSGAQLWSTPVPRPYALAIAPNGTIASASTSSISWLAADTGAILGQAPTRDGAHLLVGVGVHVRAYGDVMTGIDSSGNVLWEVKGASTIQAPLAVGDDGTLYRAEDGKLLAYRGKGGATAPTTPSGGATPPATSGATPPTSGATPGGSDGTDNGAPGPGGALVLLAGAAVALASRRRAR